MRSDAPARYVAFLRHDRVNETARRAVVSASLEDRIAVVTRWVLEADRKQFEYALDLGSRAVDAGTGSDHRTRCLNALAEFG